MVAGLTPVSLDDKYTHTEGRIFLSGVQALVRLPLVQRARDKAAGLNKNPQRSAGFKVLKAPDVPSVLLELGYLSSQKDAALLSAPEWREKTAIAVAKSVNSFFDMRTGPQATDAGAEAGLDAGPEAALGKRGN